MKALFEFLVAPAECYISIICWIFDIEAITETVFFDEEDDDDQNPVK